MTDRIDWRRLAGAPEFCDASRLTFGADAALVAHHCRGRPVYLATPYTRQVVDSECKFCRTRSDGMSAEAARHVAELALRGITAISPIVLSVAATNAAPAALDPLDQELWQNWCWPLLATCGAVVVPDIAGWQQSRGVWREVLWSLSRALPVFVYADAEAVA